MKFSTMFVQPSITIVIGNGLNELRNVTTTANDAIRSFTDNVVGDDGYISDARSTVDDGFGRVRSYDTAR